jgi:ketosteroid isomerase-like protein
MQAMSLKLPKPIARYLAAVEEKNSDELARCFSEDAAVYDEGETYHGQDAIKAWSEETNGKYKYTMEALDASVTGKTVQVRAKVTGNFPGSPVELEYLFTLVADKIISLKIE